MDTKPYVVIAGLDGLPGLQAARIFARRGIPVIGIAADRRHFCCRTRVCREILVADTKTEELAELLEQMGPGFSKPPVLLPCLDETVQVISRHRRRLEPWYRFNLPDPFVVELAMDKSLFYRYAEAHGFNVPKSFAIKNADDMERAARQMDYPCILKPKGRTSAWKNHSAYKAFKVASREELQSLYEMCRHWCDVLVLQEWIPGPDENFYTCNAYYDMQAQPQVSFVSHKLRQWPPEVGGEGCLSEDCRNDEVLQETLRLFDLMNLRGLGYLEMKRDPLSGRHVIIEPNIGRPTGRSAIAEAGGVELLYTLYCDLLGWPLPENRTQTFTGVKWIHLVRDGVSALHYWRRRQLSLAGWWRSVRGRKVYAVFSLRDPGPFCGDIIRAVHMLLSPHERKRRKREGRVANADEIRTTSCPDIATHQTTS